MKIAFVNLNKGDATNLGIVSLLTCIHKERLVVETETFDININQPLSEDIIKYNPNVVAISSMTYFYNSAIILAKKIKEELPRCKVIIGGSHISTLPVSLDPIFDFGVIGEGEITIIEFLRNGLKNNFNKNKLKEVDGLAFYENNQLIVTNPRKFIEDLDTIPYLDKSLIPKEYLKKHVLQDGTYGRKLPLITSRGCPYCCAFCSSSVFWGQKVRYHSAEYVVKEIKDYVQNYDVSYIHFWDDLFTINRPRLKKIAELLKKENIKITASAEIRANLVDDELCGILKDIGVVSIGFGFESGNDRILKFLKKNVTVEDNKRAIDICKKHGFLVQGSVIFASPTETLKEMEETEEFLEYCIEKDCENLWTYVLTPLPGTEVWEIAKQRGKVFDVGMDWNKLSLHRVDDPLLLDSEINIEDFKKKILEVRLKLRYFKWKKIKRDLKRNPLTLIKNTLRNPDLFYKLIFRKPINEEYWQIKSKQLPPKRSGFKHN